MCICICNFAFICKSHYIKVILKEVGYLGNPSDTYKFTNKLSADIIQNNVEFCEKYKLKVTDDQKTLPIMYWIPKMHKNPTSCRFIVASSKCSTKPLSKGVSKIFKLIFNQVQSFHDKSTFYANYKKFWVVENSTPVINKLERINSKNNAKSISTYDFSTLYTKIEHHNLLKILFEIIDFVFSAGRKKYIAFSNKSAYWTNNKWNSFSKTSLKTAVKHLITECYFTIGDIVLLQIIGIPMGIDPAPFWANLYLYKYECNFVSGLIHSNKSKAMKFNGSYRFIDDLCALNDSGEFGASYKDIYPPELELKVEHHGNHATFLDLDITLIDGKCVYKLFDKRDAFPFFIVRMPHLSSNIPSFIFYGSFMSEILRIARSTLLYLDFLPRVSTLYKRMITQGGTANQLKTGIFKVIKNHTTAFASFDKTCRDIINDILNLDKILIH